MTHWQPKKQALCSITTPEESSQTHSCTLLTKESSWIIYSLSSHIECSSHYHPERFSRDLGYLLRCWTGETLRGSIHSGRTCSSHSIPGLVGESHSPPEVVSMTRKESSLEYIEDLPLAPTPAVSSDVLPDKLSSGDVMDGICELGSVSSMLPCKAANQSAGKLLWRRRLSLPSWGWFPNKSAAWQGASKITNGTERNSRNKHIPLNQKTLTTHKSWKLS